MNPQFQPPPPNRPSPAGNNFQNIPLGPPMSNGPQSNNIPGGLPPFQPPPPSGGGVNRGFPGIPPNQLPPQPAGRVGLSKGQMGGLAGPPGGLQGFQQAMPPPPQSQTPTNFPPPPPPQSATPTTTAQQPPPPPQQQQGPPPNHPPPPPVAAITPNQPPSNNTPFPPQGAPTPNSQFPPPGPPKTSNFSENGIQNGFAPPQRQQQQQPVGGFNPPQQATNGPSLGQFGGGGGGQFPLAGGFNPQQPTNGPNQGQFPPGGGFPPMGSIPPGPMKPTNFPPPQPQTNHFNAPPLPGQQQQQPPPFGQQNQFSQQQQFAPPPPTQLTQQMQGMNLSGPRQYPPGGPVKGSGYDGGPHMPPPLSQQQQQLVNGQQLRSPQQQPQGQGYPPLPPGQQQQQQQQYQGGYPPQAGGYPTQSAYQQAQAQQQRRLDPDQMPSPIQVMQDDQQTRSGVFVTNQKGLVPPLVTTKFVVQDQGNASPRYVRSTMYNVPISQDLIKQTAVPFGLVISPMAKTLDGEYPPPIVNFGDLGPVRCIRCKAYMCPFMQFIDSGRRFQCLFCKAATDVPAEYFQHLDHTGQRMDRFERPELVLGTYEFTATPDYCRNNVLPKAPAMIFVIDVSYNNIKSGLISLLCAQMKEVIKNLPVDQGQEKSNMRVGFITYNSSVHFYNIKGNLAAPQMLVVGDVQDMFMPLLDGFLCTPEESETVIDALMEQIPAMFGETRETETVLLPAIVAGLEALKASECVGKLLVFHSSLPTAEAPGKLRMRDERKLLGTEKERTVLTPQTQAYNQLGQECVQAGCSVDLFVFNNSYIDIATIGQVARLTGGEVYKYTYFQADVDGERLIKDLVRNISRPIAFDAVMRVRTSTGVRPTDFYGHCFMSNTTDVELAAIDCDKALAVEVKHDDKLSEDEGVYLQIALLYTSCAGQRRLRILNLSLKTCSQMADLYRSCELDTMINFFAKQSAFRLLEHNPKAVKDGIINRSAQILANYRKNCASPSSAGQLILPECMKLLPLYINCLLKSDALSGGADMTIDDRSFAMQAVMTMDVPSSLVYFYPRLIPLHEINLEEEPLEIPFPIRCTIEKMSEQGVYVLENGIHMFVWIGLGADQEFVQQVFGVPSAVQVNIEMTRFPELDNPLNQAVRTVVEKIRSQHHRYSRLTFVRPREKLEPVFKHFLVEDRGVDGSSSYVDFLCHMHKEIRNLLS